MEHGRQTGAGHSALRKGRSSDAGRIYLVTFVTTNRVSTFIDWNNATTCIRAFRSRHVWRESRLLCWVLMPDHWHGLVELGTMDELSMLINRFKGVTARAVNARLGVRGHVWSKGFHDRALRADDDVTAAARYIVRNPIRSGLVAHAGLYPFWDAVWLEPP